MPLPTDHDASQPLAPPLGQFSPLGRAPSPSLALRESDARADTAPASVNGLAAAAGATYPQLAAAWWAWLMTLPLTNSAGAIHPLFDTPFFDVAEGQRPEVWFLSTPFGNVTRSCVIPPGTWIFLALLNAECSSLEDLESGFYGNTAAEQGACAKFWADHIVNLFCEIDGVPVPDLGAYRVLSPQITFTAPTPWVYGAIGGTGTSVGDGYFVLISPFNPGQHTLRCGGGFLFRRPVDPFEDYYPVEMTYFLTVPEAPL